MADKSTCDRCGGREFVYPADKLVGEPCPSCAAADSSANGPEPAPEVIMDANGAYWRRYEDGSLSMCPTSTDNEPLAEPIVRYLPVSAVGQA